MPIAALLVGIVCSQALIQATSSIVNARLTTKLQVQMEAAVYARVMLLPPAWFKSYAPGNLAHRVTSMSLFVQLFAQNALGVGLTCIFSLAYVAQIFSFAPSLVWPSLIVTLLTLGVSLLCQRRTGHRLHRLFPSVEQPVALFVVLQNLQHTGKIP